MKPETDHKIYEIFRRVMTEEKYKEMVQTLNDVTTELELTEYTDEQWEKIQCFHWSISQMYTAMLELAIEEG